MNAIIIRRIFGAIVFIGAAVAGYLLKTHSTPGSGKRNEDAERTVNNLVIGGKGEGHLRKFNYKVENMDEGRMI